MNKDQAVMLIFLFVFLSALFVSALFFRARAAWRKSKIKWRYRTVKADVRSWFERVIYCHHNADVLVDTERRLSVLLEHVTGGRLSKAGYDTETMIIHADEHAELECLEAICEVREEYVDAIESAKSEAVRKFIDDLPPRVREKLNKNLAKAKGGAYAPIKKAVASPAMQPVRSYLRKARRKSIPDHPNCTIAGFVDAGKFEFAPGLRSTVADPQHVCRPGCASYQTPANTAVRNACDCR